MSTRVHGCMVVPTSHAIVGETFTKLIPHNEEHGEWKSSQLAKLLHKQNEKRSHTCKDKTG